MLPRRNRYLGQITGDFFARAQKTSLPYGKQFFYAAANITQPQFAFIVAKKYFAKSCWRHRIKRLLHAHFAAHLDDFSPGVYVIIVTSFPRLMSPSEN